jgi:hypothetical protein
VWLSVAATRLTGQLRSRKKRKKEEERKERRTDGVHVIRYVQTHERRDAHQNPYERDPYAKSRTSEVGGVVMLNGENEVNVVKDRCDIPADTLKWLGEVSRT